MPLYDYRCQQCNHEFELLQLGKELAQCPLCASHDLDRLMSGFSVRGGAKEAGVASSSKCSGCAGGSCGTCH
ncbi:MAG: zinc ribbon domain-containing protein [Desulfobulbaceae bacterium]|nr:zinc ribbon domain-containing protein [Desulfobulbaceae bacterium]